MFCREIKTENILRFNNIYYELELSELKNNNPYFIDNNF